MAFFTVFGNPVAHSLSPQIHDAFAAQHGLGILYTRSLTSAGQFRRAVSDFFYCGGAGANVTVPFKQAAYELATHLTARAAKARAVNTLIPLGLGQLLGDNTDGIGLITDLQVNCHQQLNQRQVVLLGAGGAARGALYALLEQPVASITIVNRTTARAEQLAQDSQDSRVTACTFDALAIPKGALVINATSISLTDKSAAALLPIAAAELGKADCAYDMMYGAEPTVFMQQAQNAGVNNVFDGLGMLVEQAAVAFKLWHDLQQVNTQQVIEQLRAQLNG
ncbi:shikimate dehydrogenase [Pseudidiomarina woesei]|uniref:Shikimate dehydrogenase (NADP(+)) n=1 Tax=Pseudidiomarina woesei TaxID=1381080 RepID=A0A0K6H9F1_9GAMM|nr:shikimate dehydrogenase [Pseudidiomarina woesei]CUA87470.1 shikimate dehydrogenase [Pseudidiomarina woesei]